VASSLGAHSLLYGLRRDHAFHVQALVSFRHSPQALRPLLQDVDEMVGNVQFVVMYRDPRASSYSTLRRGFDKDLRGLAVLCSLRQFRKIV
jgi:hypothetical protein